MEEGNYSSSAGTNYLSIILDRQKVPLQCSNRQNYHDSKRLSHEGIKSLAYLS